MIEEKVETIERVTCSKCGGGVKEEQDIAPHDLHKLICISCGHFAYVGNHFALKSI